MIYFDKDGDGTPDHAGIITKVSDGMVYYSGHTVNRKNEPVSNYFKNYKNGKVYILVMI